MQEKLKNLPNSITVMRMVGTVSLLFTKPMSLLFYIVYCITGLVDVLDVFLSVNLRFPAISVQNLTVLQTFCFIR